MHEWVRDKYEIGLTTSLNRIKLAEVTLVSFLKPENHSLLLVAIISH